MTTYLLDTNICVHIINGKFDLAARLKRAGLTACFLSELTVAELLYGVANSSPTHQLANRQRLTQFQRLFDERVLPISDSLETYAQQKAHLKRIGRLQGEFDMLIGSVVVAHGLTLVTHNTRHFFDMVGIVLEDWVQEYEDEQQAQQAR
ncbi:type II toxin-antitoxin system VapC family toxin [Hymenobacter sp. RP-2-7]|uniref:Ribonuclease VapC n=1 Tax=Hymenobacter polaris TaxID=2682546 RepID=A0A7Y0AAQ7_9BACT|nr:PIN domain-containing protein [Hymenobacter polaris]NML63635.1 type II toxin-antitoxin system VapC family toxin [Hymenobacter polaris]